MTALVELLQGQFIFNSYRFMRLLRIFFLMFFLTLVLNNVSAQSYVLTPIPVDVSNDLVENNKKSGKGRIVMVNCYDEAYGYNLADDVDNDGVVYYFDLQDEQTRPLTLEEYNQLVDKYFPEDELIDLNMQKFTIENIEKLA